MLKKIKDYIIKDALTKAETVFDRVKIYTLYSIIVFHTIVYIVGSIPIFVGDYPALQLIQIIGFSFIVLIAISLRRTKSFKLPGIIWMIGGIVYTSLVTIASQGELSYISFAVLILNIIASFLVLDRGMLIVNLGYYIFYFLITLSIHFNYLPRLDFGLNLSREIEFMNQSNLFPIVLVMLMISYIVMVYVSSHQKAIDTISSQQEDAIEHQKLIASKSIAIENSIDYAVEIQNSVLSESAKFETFFKNNFVFFKPKAKLSGDFYWVFERDNLIYFALIDTAEGGVSGAILSVICRNGLRKAVQELKLISPAAILDYLEHYVEKTLIKGRQKNGINVSLCTFNKKNNKLFYAGANCPIYILRNSKIIEYKAHPHPISENFDAINFKNIEIQLNANDVLYLFTDGYANQFGGERGEKLNDDAFKSILVSTYNSNLTYQKNAVTLTFDDWKGEHEQLDDICLIGLKI